MPYVTHEAHTEYVHEEYPKMLTQKDKDGLDKPVLYPRDHAKGGLPVVFESADDEEAYNKPKVVKASVKKDK